MNTPPPAHTRRVYEFGPFILDPQDKTQGRLVKDDEDWPIPNKLFDLLCVLVVNHGHVISCEQLIRDVWKENPDPKDVIRHESASGKLHTTIKRLRAFIGETKETEIQNRHGGYVFLGNVSQKTSRKGGHEAFTFSWIFFSPECWKTKILVIAGSLLSLLYVTQYLLKEFLIPGYGPPIDPRLVLSVVQFLTVAGIFTASFVLLDPKERVFPSSTVEDRKLMKLCGYTNLKAWRIAKRSAKKSLRLFFRYWKLLLSAWGLLWFIMIWNFTGLHQLHFEKLEHALNIVATSLNNYNSVAIALCYVVLNHPTISSSNVSNTNLVRLSKNLEGWGGLGIILFASCEVLLLLIKSNQWLTTELPLFDVISGLIGGISLALFVGRIQSKFLGSSSWLPAVLYAYVAIQSLYMAIAPPQSQKGGAILIATSLLLKCLLFLYVVWLVKSGRLLFYFVRVRTIYDKANPEWRKFILNLSRKKHANSGTRPLAH